MYNWNFFSGGTQWYDVAATLFLKHKNKNKCLLKWRNKKFGIRKNIYLT